MDIAYVVYFCNTSQGLVFRLHESPFKIGNNKTIESFGVTTTFKIIESGH